MTMKVGVRPIEESDAPLLTRWENWSDAAYFLGNEYGMFLATNYDREMDSLHPRGIEQELMIVSRRNEPLGLLKLRPEQRLGMARVWFFLKDPAGYGDSGLRKSFGHILKEAAGQTTFSTLVAAAGPGDPGLAEFLESLGFTRAGTERQALFVHDAYRDVEVYTLRM
jgi:RimJ/RimL family protein N-acetyltransferase